MHGSYDSRSHLSVIEHNTKDESRKNIHKNLARSSTGSYCKKILKTSKGQTRREGKENKSKLKNVKRRRLIMSGPDSHYGNVNAVNKMSKAEFEMKKEKFKDQLRLIEYERNRLQEKTISQSNSYLGMAERSKRLTASHLGKICKTKSSTSRVKTAISIIYRSFQWNKATKYGLEKEPIDIEQLCKELGK
ncbi:hypothetical protein PR048_020211 [Dryococelus australis]|uniref:Uncharacterized protein n=1 Tax=Dryococelus australis TaxID=614101 RepID=A0ABQ9H5N4_9NEOP|nr:hypothetical protein PR048_020211 [Dryococelus australis]